MTDFSSGLAAAEELALLEPETANNFSETFCFSGYDNALDLGWFIHLQAKPFAWHVRLYVYLPGARDFLYAVADSDERIPERPGAADLHIRCVEPFRRWSIVGNLLASPLTIDDMRAGRNTDRTSVPLALHLDVEAVAPVWAIGGDDGSTPEEHGNRGFRTHLQQLMMSSGMVRIGTRTHDFGGSCWRDHSRGPRTLKTWGSHALMSAWFPRQRCGFGLLRQTAADGRLVVDEAYLCRQGVIERADLIEVTPLHDVDELHSKAVVVLRAHDGESWRAEGVVLTQILLPIGPSSWISEGQARWSMRGEEAFGLCERSSSG